MTLPKNENLNGPRVPRNRGDRPQRRVRNRTTAVLPQPQPQPQPQSQNLILQRFSDQIVTEFNFNINDEKETKTLTSGSTYFAKQMSVMTEFMVSRIKNVKNTKEFSKLKQIADKAQVIYKKFIISSDAIDFLDLKEPYEKVSALSLNFNQIYMQAFEAKKTDEREKISADLIAEEIKNHLENAIAKVDSIIKNMSGKIENSSANYSNLQSLLKKTLELKEKLTKFKPQQNENLKKANKRIAGLYKHAEKNSKQFDNLLREKSTVLENSKNFECQRQYQIIAQENLKKLERILLGLAVRQSDIMAPQQTWLVTQGNIMSLSGKEERDDIKDSIPGAKELLIINEKTVNSLKDLAGFVEIKMDVQQNVSSKIIMAECQQYLSAHHDNLEKLKSFSEKLANALPPLQLCFDEITNLYKIVSDLASQALNIQRALTQNIREPSRNKRRRPKNVRTTGAVSTTSGKCAEPSSSFALLEQKKNPAGIKSLPLQPTSAFASSIPGVETPATNFISSCSSSSLFADSFNYSSSSSLPGRHVQVRLDDLVVKKLIEDRIKDVLEDLAVIDLNLETEEKINLASMQEMLIKQNALLMMFCQFSESLLQKNINLPPHFENLSFINKARNCIYHNFSNVFSCSWPTKPEDLADAQLRITMYKKVVVLLTALHDSITDVDYRKLSENELFQKLIKSYDTRPLDSAEADAELVVEYFENIVKANLSLSFTFETQELAGKFALGAKGAAAKDSGCKPTNDPTPSLMRHEALLPSMT